MKDVFWVIPEQLAGRSGPDQEAWSLKELRAAGFQVVINLTETELSREEFVAAGLELEWIPIPSTYPADLPSEKANLAAVPIACASVQAHLKAGRPVLVHCAWGRDRTGLVLAAYLAMTEKLSPAEAIARVRQVRPKAISPGVEEMSVRVIEAMLRRG